MNQDGRDHGLWLQERMGWADQDVGVRYDFGGGDW